MNANQNLSDLDFGGDTMSQDDAAGIVSDDALKSFELACYVILSGSIGVFGSIANVLNIIVFVKQGFSDSINISLMGLAISDLGALLSLVWMSVCFAPFFRYSYDYGMDALKIQYITAGWPHVCFARITSYITAFITFERCICIALPLKVKQIITPRRTLLVVAGIFFVMLATLAPVFYAVRITMVFEDSVNESVLSFVHAESGPDIENVSFSIYVFAQISSFVIVIACTVVLIQCLVRKSKWRKSTSSADDPHVLRDKKVMKMVLCVAVIFIICFFPTAVNLILMISFEEYSLVGQEANLFLTGWGFLNTIEAINSTVNIFIYYNMSTKYRTQLQSLFSIKSSEKKNHRSVTSSTNQDG